MSGDNTVNVTNPVVANQQVDEQQQRNLDVDNAVRKGIDAFDANLAKGFRCLRGPDHKVQFVKIGSDREMETLGGPVQLEVPEGMELGALQANIVGQLQKIAEEKIGRRDQYENTARMPMFHEIDNKVQGLAPVKVKIPEELLKWASPTPTQMIDSRSDNEIRKLLTGISVGSARQLASDPDLKGRAALTNMWLNMDYGGAINRATEDRKQMDKVANALATTAVTAEETNAWIFGGEVEGNKIRGIIDKDEQQKVLSYLVTTDKTADTSRASEVLSRAIAKGETSFINAAYKGHQDLFLQLDTPSLVKLSKMNLGEGAMPSGPQMAGSIITMQALELAGHRSSKLDVDVLFDAKDGNPEFAKAALSKDLLLQLHSANVSTGAVAGGIASSMLTADFSLLAKTAQDNPALVKDILLNPASQDEIFKNINNGGEKTNRDTFAVAVGTVLASDAISTEDRVKVAKAILGHKHYERTMRKVGKQDFRKAGAFEALLIKTVREGSEQISQTAATVATSAEVAKPEVAKIADERVALTIDEPPPAAQEDKIVPKEITQVSPEARRAPASAKWLTGIGVTPETNPTKLAAQVAHWGKLLQDAGYSVLGTKEGTTLKDCGPKAQQAAKDAMADAGIAPTAPDSARLEKVLLEKAPKTREVQEIKPAWVLGSIKYTNFDKFVSDSVASFEKVSRSDKDSPSAHKRMIGFATDMGAAIAKEVKNGKYGAEGLAVLEKEGKKFILEQLKAANGRHSPANYINEGNLAEAAEKAYVGIKTFIAGIDLDLEKLKSKTGTDSELKVAKEKVLQSMQKKDWGEVVKELRGFDESQKELAIELVIGLESKMDGYTVGHTKTNVATHSQRLEYAKLAADLGVADKIAPTLVKLLGTGKRGEAADIIVKLAAKDPAAAAAKLAQEILPKLNDENVESLLSHLVSKVESPKFFNLMAGGIADGLKSIDWQARRPLVETLITKLGKEGFLQLVFGSESLLKVLNDVAISGTVSNGPLGLEMRARIAFVDYVKQNPQGTKDYGAAWNAFGIHEGKSIRHQTLNSLEETERMKLFDFAKTLSA